MTTKPKAMTAPTTLAETIARVEECPAMPTVEDVMVLLACARRCEAIEAVLADGLSSKAFWSEVEGKLLYAAVDVDAYFDSVLCHLLSKAADAAVVSADLRSERDALAKRVGELEGDAASQLINKLEAESTRLRAENESIRADNRMLLAKVDDATEQAEDAQDRVRELEEALAIVRHNEARLTEVSMLRSRLLAEHGIKEPLHPVTLAGRTERPSCVPSDTGCVQLPSGLFAWVCGNRVFVEDRQDCLPWILYPDHHTDKDTLAGLGDADFLAARALGVRVLGWKS